MAASETSRSPLSIFLSAFLVLAVLGALALLIYSVAVPATSEKFTEFYILGPDGTTDYPTDFVAGETASVTLGVVNREQETASYRVTIGMDGTENEIWSPGSLADGEKREQEITFTPETTGDEQKVEFLLYKNGSRELYLELHLLINVRAN